MTGTILLAVFLGIILGAAALAIWHARPRVELVGDLQLRVVGHGGIYAFGLVFGNIAYALTESEARKLQDALNGALAKIDALHVERLQAHIAEHLAMADDDEKTRVAGGHASHVEAHREVLK